MNIVAASNMRAATSPNASVSFSFFKTEYRIIDQMIPLSATIISSIPPKTTML